MKKPFLNFLLTAALACLTFTLGFFLGRNLTHGPVRLAVPAAMLTAPTQAASPAKVGDTVNINTATSRELAALPGIGEVLSQRIVAYREAYGPFRAVEALVDVDGIGEQLVEDIRDLITIGG